MSCMFRIDGRSLNIDRLLSAVSLPATMSFRKGQHRSEIKKDGERNRNSGASFLVSNADFHQFEKQKKDAISFLTNKRTVIRRIMNWPGVDSACLDFGIERRDVAAQFDHLPAELLRLAGELGIDIEISQYSIEHKNESQQGDGD